MSGSGVVRAWHEDEGWGVIESAETPGGSWTHFSSVLVDGFGALAAGQAVTFEFEVAEQDGFGYRTVGAWPDGQDPVPRAEDQDTTAYQSTLMLTFDGADPSQAT